MTNLEEYRRSEKEKARTVDLLRLLPTGRRSVLDVGARDGHFSRLLAEYFDEVTALDLEKPAVESDRVGAVAGDVTRLQFADDSFDCVFCAEVLEHISDLPAACREIARVAKSEVIIGVPFRQDIRVGCTTCRSCGKVNPPWSHVNSFDENRLIGLFPDLKVISKSFVGTVKGKTNAISARLMDLGGNPWGTYNQEEPCIFCGATLTPPERRSLSQRICSAIAVRINRIQAAWTRPHAKWIHVAFSKQRS